MLCYVILFPLDLIISSYLMVMFNFNYKLILYLNMFNNILKYRYLPFFDWKTKLTKQIKNGCKNEVMLLLHSVKIRCCNNNNIMACKFNNFFSMCHIFIYRLLTNYFQLYGLLIVILNALSLSSPNQEKNESICKFLHSKIIIIIIIIIIIPLNIVKYTQPISMPFQ